MTCLVLPNYCVHACNHCRHGHIDRGRTPASYVILYCRIVVPEMYSQLLAKHMSVGVLAAGTVVEVLKFVVPWHIRISMIRDSLMWTGLVN